MQASGMGISDQLFALDDVEYGQGDGATDCVAAEGVEVPGAASEGVE